MTQPLIILGASTRGAAESARRAGYEPWCIDLRGDRDLSRHVGGVMVRVCPADQFPMGMLRMVEDGPRGAAVLLTGPLENHVGFVRAVGFERAGLGSGAQAIAAVRDPRMLPTLKPVKGMKFCETRTRASLGRRLGAMVFGIWGRKKYLLKPRDSWGGVGIQWWTAGGRIDASHYLQQYIRGEAYTAVFHADGWSCSLLGVVEQIVGDAAFGADGSRGSFRGCGYVGPVKLSEKSRAALSHLGVQLTQRCDVRGLFSVDFIMDMGGTLWPIEVNPRYPAAAEVLERAEGMATLTGTRPPPRRTVDTHGMASVLARRDVVAPDLYDLFTKDEIADVPPIGRPIPRDDRICTVIAHGPGRDAVVIRLKEMAAKVYQRIEGHPPAPPETPVPPKTPTAREARHGA